MIAKHLIARSTLALITLLSLGACTCQVAFLDHNKSSRAGSGSAQAQSDSTRNSSSDTTYGSTAQTSRNGLGFGAPAASSSETQVNIQSQTSQYPGARRNAFGGFGLIPASGPRKSSVEASSNLRHVTYTSEGSDFDPDIDPTGKWLVYASTRHRQTSGLYLQQVDGTTVIQLTNDQANDAMPVFSPDGKWIAFSSDRSGNWDIYIVPLDGGQPVQLTNDPANDIHPSFAPDGKFVVYSSQDQTSGQWEMVVIEVDKPGNKRLIGQGLFPDWSPVENKIVFQKARERGTRWFSVWTIELVGGDWIRPTEIAAGANAAAITPRWSPDGRHITFCTVVNPDAYTDPQAKPLQADVWLMATDGTNRTNLTQSRYVNTQPIWAHDGAIYFVSNRSGKNTDNIWSIRPDRMINTAMTARAKQPTMPPHQPEPQAQAQTQHPTQTQNEQADHQMEEDQSALVTTH